jgi:beta-phosphoglucomutase family hydrolase
MSQQTAGSPESAARSLGLPPGIRGCLFDLDGVITRTAAQHARAWKSMFDDFLRAHAQETGGPFVPFDIETDYVAYVDGRKRLDGTRGFLDARGIVLPDGSPSDPPGAHTLQGLSNAKNTLVLDLIAREGVQVFDDAKVYLHAARDAGVPRAVVTSSANAEQVLAVSGLTDLFDVRVDAHVAAARGLAGKPAPDTFLAGADLLGIAPAQAVVFEDALAGVRAGRAGGFGFVVGVDRVGQADGLRAAGADVVVPALTDLMEAR